jgi:hypothetical protein
MYLVCTYRERERNFEFTNLEFAILRKYGTFVQMYLVYVCRAGAVYMYVAVECVYGDVWSYDQHVGENEIL